MKETIYIPFYNSNATWIAIVSVLAVFSISIFSFPRLFLFFFNEVLGNILLVLVVLGIYMLDPRWAVAIASIFIILYQAFHLSSASASASKEGFSWSPELIEHFKLFQSTFNPDIVFDMNIVQQQASAEEVQYLLKNNKWPWSDSVQNMYKEAIMHDSMVRIQPGIAMNIAQTIYNENAILQILSWNTQEGNFLLFGATVKTEEDSKPHTVRCAGADGLEKVTEHGGKIEPADIPSAVPGFSFLKEPCNPCSPLNRIPDYSCPFSIRDGEREREGEGEGFNVSSVWKHLWGI